MPHPDLTWVTPSGAHEMLRADVAKPVVEAAAHTPFEAARRVFVLEHADSMNDEAANTLLKTLEEPPSYAVLILLSDKPGQVLPTIASRCQMVRFDPAPPATIAARLEGVDGDAGARLRAPGPRRRPPRGRAGDGRGSGAACGGRGARSRG